MLTVRCEEGMVDRDISADQKYSPPFLTDVLKLPKQLYSEGSAQRSSQHLVVQIKF